MNEKEDFDASMRTYTRELAIGETYLDWLYGAEASVCDHEWSVESHIGPDSGSEDFHCQKCGTTHVVNWY